MIKFKKALGASLITSILMVLDRIVVNFIPLFFWGPEVAGIWIFLRSWSFFLSALEGGVGGKFSNWISEISIKDDIQIKNKYDEVSGYQLRWGLLVFAVHIIIIIIISMKDILWFDIDDYLWSFILIGLYSILYYQTQVIVYQMKGMGNIFQGQMTANFIKLLEVLSCIAIPILGGNIFETVLSLVVIRFLAVLTIGRVDIKSIFNGGLQLNFSYFLFPLTPAINNFIPILVVGHLFGSKSVALFSISKMFGLVLMQASQIISRILWPSLMVVKNTKQRLKFAQKTFKNYISISFLILIVMLLISSFVDGYGFNGILFDKNLVMVLCLWAFLCSLSDIFISIFISFDFHFYPLLIRLTFGLMPLILLINSYNIALNVYAIYIMIIELLVCFTLFLFYRKLVLRIC